MTHIRKPKTIESLYRQQLAFRNDMENQLTIIRLELIDLSRCLEDVDTKLERADRRLTTVMLPVVDHCHRLLRQKEVLRGQLEEANRFIAANRMAP